jgi:uncharacterized protein (DUF1501 family)
MEPTTIDRRSLLTGLSCLAAASLLPRAFARVSSSGAAGSEPVLVLLELAGGNDGLNTVIPHGDDAYAALRKGLAIDASEVRRLDAEVGFHPALEQLHARYDAGRVAVIEGVGYPNPTRSHFLSTDVWHAGSLEGRRLGNGWVGRLADAAYARLQDPNAVIALGAKVPFCCEGDDYRAIALSSTRSYRVAGGERLVETLDSAVSSAKVSERARTFLQKAYLEARASSEAVERAVASYRPGAEYPSNNPLAGSLRTIASLLAGGLGTRVFHAQMGGFDTHNNQLARHRGLLAQLDAALAAFCSDLEAHGIADRVVVLVHSEFGRRVKPNASGGTDHGAASATFVIGEKVRGGRYGARSSLDALDDNGDLVFTTDFRSVYATLLERWLGADARAILRGEFPLLGFLA